MDFNLQKMLDVYLGGAKPRDNTASFHMSDMGMCLRKRILKRLGKSSEPIPERTLRLFEMGHVVHDYIQKMIEDEGLLFAKELTVRLDEFELVGHFDAIIKFNGKYSLLELKTVHSRKILYDTVDKHYVLQGMAYWMAFEKNNPQTKIDELIVAMISRDDWLMKEVHYKLDDYWKKEVGDELQALFAAWLKRDKELPAELEKTDPMAWQCGWCGFIQFCPEAQARLKEPKVKKSKKGVKNVTVTS